MYDTPRRPPKRARLSSPMAPRRLFTNRARPNYRVPRSLLPEMKQHSSDVMATFGTDHCYTHVFNAMTQGDSASQFIGNKIRAKRLRVMYDYSTFTSGAARIVVTIPKLSTSTLTGVVVDCHTPVPTDLHTVLMDRVINLKSGDLNNGQFDIKLNMEMIRIGANAYRNDLLIHVFSPGNGAAARVITGYALWYTDN